MAYPPLVVKVGAAHLRCNDNFDGRPSSWHILLAERTCYLPAGSIPPRDRTPCRCYASSFRHMRCMHTASRAKPSSSARFIHRQHMYVMCHRPARRRRRRRQLQRIGTSCFVCPMPPLHVCIICICTLNNPPSSSRTQPRNRRETTIDFFSVAAPQIRKLTQTRALHTRAAIIRVTQLNSTQPNPTQPRTILSLPTTTSLATRT